MTIILSLAAFAFIWAGHPWIAVGCLVGACIMAICGAYSDRH